MIDSSCKIADLMILTPDIYEDERGRFHRSYCEKELAELGITFQVKQGNLSDNFIEALREELLSYGANTTLSSLSLH